MMITSLAFVLVAAYVATWRYLAGHDRGYRLGVESARGLPTHWGQLRHSFEVVDRMTSDPSILLVSTGGLEMVVYTDCPELMNAAPGTTWSVCEEDGARRAVPTTR